MKIRYKKLKQPFGLISKSIYIKKVCIGNIQKGIENKNDYLVFIDLPGIDMFYSEGKGMKEKIQKLVDDWFKECGVK